MNLRAMCAEVKFSKLGMSMPLSMTVRAIANSFSSALASKPLDRTAPQNTVDQSSGSREGACLEERGKGPIALRACTPRVFTLACHNPELVTPLPSNNVPANNKEYESLSWEAVAASGALACTRFIQFAILRKTY